MKARGTATEELLVLWKKRNWRVNGIGFWMKEGGVEWHHPSSMPRGLGRAWREAKRAKV